MLGDVVGSTGIGNSVVGLRGQPISGTTPNVGDALVFDGSEWVPTQLGFRGTLRTTSTRTWTAPPGVRSVMVELRGAGGGGGCVGRGSMGGGGGGGHYRKVVAVTPGTEYTISIGASGQGCVFDAGGSHSPATDGGQSTFGPAGQATLVAPGGEAGNNGQDCAPDPSNCQTGGDGAFGGAGGRVTLDPAAVFVHGLSGGPGTSGWRRFTSDGSTLDLIGECGFGGPSALGSAGTPRTGGTGGGDSEDDQRRPEGVCVGGLADSGSDGDAGDAILTW